MKCTNEDAPATAHTLPREQRAQVAAVARREWEQVGASPLNQALPFAPVVNFDDLLRTSGDAAPPPRNATPPGAGAGTSTFASRTADKGDAVRGADLVLFVSSGLQHLPGAEDAPVTPTSGPAIGFWLRPFNFHNESAAMSQPGSVAYMPALSARAAQAAARAASRRDAAFTLAPTYGLAPPSGNASADAALGARGLGVDDAQRVLIASPAALLAARRGLQPYVGVPAAAACLPDWASVPAFNGTYDEMDSVPAGEQDAGGGGGGSAGRAGARSDRGSGDAPEESAAEAAPASAAQPRTSG
jgi:hypothetical protein